MQFIAARLTPRRCMLAAVTLFALMVILGAIPGKAQTLTNAVNDKLLHFLAYGLLSALTYGALRAHAAVRSACTLAAIGTLGALDEAIQSFLPYREASWFDWEVDMIAALTSVAVLSLIHSLYSGSAPQQTVPGVRHDRLE